MTRGPAHTSLAKRWPSATYERRRSGLLVASLASLFTCAGCEGDEPTAAVPDASDTVLEDVPGEEIATTDTALGEVGPADGDTVEPDTAIAVDTGAPDAEPINGDERCAEIEDATRFLFDERWLVSAMVALVDEDGTAYCSLGTLDGTPEGARPDARTFYEIGSVTKVVTGILLAHLAADGVVALDQTAASLLPEDVRVPSAHGIDITLTHLSSHHSGLPRMPTNFAPADPADPFADYTLDDLYAFLGAHQLARDPGAAFEYSNLGVALLGHALERATDRSWRELAHERVLTPMGMHETAVTLDPSQAQRLAPPFTVDAEPGRSWDLGIFVAAGGLRSTARDMARFVRVAAGMGTAGASTDQAIAESQRARYPGIGLGWGVSPELFGHSGQTGGYHCTLLVDRVVAGGVVALGNTGNDGLEHLAAVAFAVRRAAPLPTPSLQRLGEPPADLSPFVGTYAVGDFDARIAIRDGRLDYFERGQGPFRLWPSGGDRFHLRIAPVEFEFLRDSQSGLVTTMRVHQSGASFDVPRIEP